MRLQQVLFGKDILSYEEKEAYINEQIKLINLAKKKIEEATYILADVKEIPLIVENVRIALNYIIEKWTSGSGAKIVAGEGLQEAIDQLEYLQYKLFKEREYEKR